MNEEAQKNKSLVAARTQAKIALLAVARPLYTTIQANPDVTYQAKIDMGIRVKSPPSHIGAPGVVPLLSVASVFGRSVKLQIRNPINNRRSLPANCVGVTLFRFFGGAPPSGDQVWQPLGNVTKSEIVDVLPDGTAPNTRVWYTCYYYTQRGLSGDACTPTSGYTTNDGADPLSA